MFLTTSGITHQFTVVFWEDLVDHLEGLVCLLCLFVFYGLQYLKAAANYGQTVGNHLLQRLPAFFLLVLDQPLRLLHIKLCAVLLGAIEQHNAHRSKSVEDIFGISLPLVVLEQLGAFCVSQVGIILVRDAGEDFRSL